MTIRLEVEHTYLNRDKPTKSRELLLELDDRTGVHGTPFGNVEIDVKKVRVNHGCEAELKRKSGYRGTIYYRGPPYNTDIVIETRNAPQLAEKLKAPIRRISVGTYGYGAQQIGRGATLIVHSDSFRREK